MTGQPRPTVRPRCPYTNPGIRSVNHPDKPIRAPWRCTREAGHEGGHAPVEICPLTVDVQRRPWPCVLAAGHDGDCRPDPASRWLARPPRRMDREELIQSIALMASALSAAERNARDLNGHLTRGQQQVEAVAAHVLGSVKSPHGNSHTGDCWLRHPHCLAFAIIGSYGLERALEHLDSARRAPDEPRDLLDLIQEA